jgi:hypothetical protein
MESINTSISISELCRKDSVVPNMFYQRKERFLEAGKLGLSGGIKNGDATSAFPSLAEVGGLPTREPILNTENASR